MHCYNGGGIIKGLGKGCLIWADFRIIGFLNIYTLYLDLINKQNKIRSNYKTFNHSKLENM